MRNALIAVAVSFCSSVSASAADGVWTIAIVGSREVAVAVRQAAEDVFVADLRLLARDLNIDVQVRGDEVVIRDSVGSEWHTSHGSVLLEGPAARRTLTAPVSVAAGAVGLPLDAIAALAGRTLVVESTGRALLLRPSAAASSIKSDVRAPAGWQRFQIAKTPSEQTERRRQEGETPIAENTHAVRDVLPPAHESVAVEVGLGVTQGVTGASDVMAAGTVNGFRLNLGTFLTFGAQGMLYRSGHVVLETPAAAWTVEAGDLSSDMRGLGRGARVVRHVGTVWHPGLSVYVRDRNLSSEPSVVAYRDDLRIAARLRLRGEVASDRSGFAGVQWVSTRANVETFFRRVASRDIEERGGMVSYDVWRGLTLRAGGKLTSGTSVERWYLAGVSVPIASIANVSLEQTRLVSARGVDTSSALGIQVPIGRVRLMQRYQITDIAFVDQPVLFGAGQRQLQSMASWSVSSRLQFNYQLATQWLANAEVRQWTELQSVLRISPATSFIAVTGFPELSDPQRFRVGIQQKLPRRFRLSIDYGRLPAFQNLAHQAETARLLVMVRRSFGVATPARGSDIAGQVLDESGRPVAGIPVSLGPYTTTAGPDGRYRFANVPKGEFALALLKEQLPAQFTSDGTEHPLDLKETTKTQVNLRVIPLNAIRGHVYIDRNDNGAFDAGEGVQNVVVRLAGDTRATMTDDTGAYGFYNLTPGIYEVRIDTERLVQDLAVASPDRVDATLEADRPTSGVDFRVRPKQKPIVMQKLPQ